MKLPDPLDRRMPAGRSLLLWYAYVAALLVGVVGVIAAIVAFAAWVVPAMFVGILTGLWWQVRQP